jgi:porin
MAVSAIRRSGLVTVAGSASLAAMLAWVPALSARAADLQVKAPPKSSQQDDFWTRDKLTGDWGGLRTALLDRGIDIELTYIGEVFGAAGGFRQGVGYEHRFELDFDTDLGKLVGWHGAATHVGIYQIGEGNGLIAARFTGSLADPSNIEALPSTRLFTAWFQQNGFDDKVSLRLGQIAADDEFFITPTGATLINSSFGWAAIMAADQFQGGPVYPLATPGVRLQVKPTDQLTLVTAVFSGAPAGENCTVLPQQCNRYGLTFSLSGGALWVGEAQYGINQGKDSTGLPGIYKLGGWYATKSFPDVHFGLTATGVPVTLASPLSVAPFDHQGNWGIYGLADQMVWRASMGPQSLNVFLRGSASPSDRNLIVAYVDGGLGLKAPVPGRDDDLVTFGVAYSAISHDVIGLDLDTELFAGMPLPVHDQEIALELEYSYQIAPWWTLQPDVQYIIHPGGHAPDPFNPTRPIADAFVGLLRTTIKF